jgi:hypothetical protein
MFAAQHGRDNPGRKWRWRAYYRGMSRKSLSLIVGAASVALAAALWSLPAIAGSGCATLTPASLAHPTWSAHRGANLANPKPASGDDDSDDSGNASGDATPVPEPQPATRRW